ncbi:hypothetical protein [Paenibacillus sp. FSL H7-0331]|uniref:hypothetical protein n=1 Tax=Paenibacillus sp. FSL H7-0331 TaxID=1920421 RepID=UPI0021164ECC|nr:hypothetical protein [Paenibacillus sp. FSL H7-0331]
MNKGGGLLMGQIRGVILEGYSHAGKTSTLKALKLLQAQEEQAERSVVILGEHYSQVLNRVHGELVALHREEHLELLHKRVAMLQELNQWAEALGQASRQSRGIFYVLERFHLNHRAAFADQDSTQVTELERTLVDLGAITILLTISPEAVEERIQSRSPAQWLDKSKSYIAAQCDELLNVQDMLRAQSKKSLIPTIEINTDSKDWSLFAKQILKQLD